MDPQTKARLRVAIKVLGGRYSFLSAEEKDILGVMWNASDDSITFKAEEILMAALVAIASEASDKSPRVYGERSSTHPIQHERFNSGY